MRKLIMVIIVLGLAGAIAGYLSSRKPSGASASSPSLDTFPDVATKAAAEPAATVS